MSISPNGRPSRQVPQLAVEAGIVALLTLGWAAAPASTWAQAEEPAEEPPAAAEAPAEAEAAEPEAPPAETPVPDEPERSDAPHSEVETVDEAQTAQEAVEEMPLTEEEKSKVGEKFMQSVTIGAGLRTGLDFIMAGDNVGPVQLSLNDGLVDQVNIRPFMSAALTEHVTAFVQFEIGTANGLGNFAILDGMAQIKIVDEFQLWIGQHIPANDRNNMNGPFFGNGWNFAITVPSYSFDAGARDRGLTAWGLIADGILKYHLSLVDLQPGQELKNSRFAGRLTLNLLDPENYYYASGSYWGGQDTLAIGAVFQYQNGDGALSDPTDPASPLVDNDFVGFSFDLFFEKNIGNAGTFTFEGGYWNWENVDNAYVVNQGTVDQGIGVVGGPPGAGLEGSAYLAMVSWLTPEPVGAGKIQANARMQYGAYSASDVLTLDFGVAYIVDGFNHKYHLNFRHQDVDPVGMPSYAAESLQFGVQYLFSK